jgi:hypothetical protein
VRHYWGDPTIAPNGGTITDMATASGVNALDAYALDEGVLPSGQTALVEANGSMIEGVPAIDTDSHCMCTYGGGFISVVST